MVRDLVTPQSSNQLGSLAREHGAKDHLQKIQKNKLKFCISHKKIFALQSNIAYWYN